MTLHNDKDEDLRFAEPSDPPAWALRTLDLATSDEDEICAIIDDVTDHDFAYMIIDSINDGDKPLAVMLPWDAYVGLIGRALP